MRKAIFRIFVVVLAGGLVGMKFQGIGGGGFVIYRDGGSGGQSGYGRGSCTDGVDCYCDRASNPSDALYDPNMIYCEDFEDPNLDWYRVKDPNDPNDKGDSGWFQKYGGQVDGCWSSTYGSLNVEGPEDYKCVDVVSLGNCDNPEDPNCVFDGNKSLGLSYQPGENHGIVGTASFTESVNTFGVTMVWKYASDWVYSSNPRKTDEFGGGANCIFGCNTNNLDQYAVIVRPNPHDPMTGWIPMASSIGVKPDTCLDGSCVPNDPILGVAGMSNNNSTMHVSPLAADYGQADHPIGSWGCHSFHISGWGTSNMVFRRWYNDKLIAHVVLNHSNPRNDEFTIGSFVFNAYANNGYNGTNESYRYEDNIHVTKGPEPISCAAIGYPVP